MQVIKDRQDIIDILLIDPIVLMMSKNAVIGLHKWLLHFGLKSDFFADADFWTVGERTHECLKKILGIESFYPDKMRGQGVKLALQKQNNSNILLMISFIFLFSQFTLKLESL